MTRMHCWSSSRKSTRQKPTKPHEKKETENENSLYRFRNDERLFPCERIRMDKETTGLLRLTISGVDPTDVGTYRCRIYNPHGEATCSAQVTYDSEYNLVLEDHGLLSSVQ